MTVPTPHSPENPWAGAPAETIVGELERLAAETPCITNRDACVLFAPCPPAPPATPSSRARERPNAPAATERPSKNLLQTPVEGPSPLVVSPPPEPVVAPAPHERPGGGR